ncbi:MAG: acyltransferase family protein [Anaerolineae bacterium]|nr:acyltransferase family protein [Anaerolineae bacterium]
MPRAKNPLKRIRAVKARYEERLLAHPGVMSVGVGLRRQGDKLTDEVCIVVMVQDKQAIENLPPDQALPGQIEGVPVDVQESGDIVVWEPPSAPETQRLHYVDTMRVAVIALLVLFHTGLIFTPFIRFVLTNRATSIDLTILTVALLHPWQMPLLFLVSGISAYFSLRKRSARRFAQERFRRLLIPFLVGLVLLIPPQVYCDTVSRGIFQGGVIDFYRFYFTLGLQQGYFSWHHLWFILYLFVITLVVLPLLKNPEQGAFGRFIERLGDVVSRRNILLIGALPLMITETLFRGGWPGYYYNLYDDWANVCLFLLVFVYGYVIAANARVQQTLYQTWKPALVIAASITAMFLLQIKLSGDRLSLTYSDPFYYLYTITSAINTWCWLVGIVGLAHEYFDRPWPLMQKASRLSYPFYLFHQTILILIAFYVIPTELSVLAKFLLIVVLTYGITFLAVAILDRVPLLHPLFGIKGNSTKQQLLPGNTSE